MDSKSILVAGALCVAFGFGGAQITKSVQADPVTVEVSAPNVVLSIRDIQAFDDLAKRAGLEVVEHITAIYCRANGSGGMDCHVRGNTQVDPSTLAKHPAPVAPVPRKGK